MLPEEQNCYGSKSRGTKDQLIIDNIILKNCKKISNLSLAWIGYTKAYDMVLHSWIIECLEIFKVSQNITTLLRNFTKNWRVELTWMGGQLGEVNIRRGIFQGDSLSPILFVIALIPLSIVLNKTKVGYGLVNNRGKINHLLYVDELKLYGKNLEELDSLVKTVRIYSKDIGIELGIEKYAMIEMKKGEMSYS